MGANFELSKYDIGDYLVFRLESQDTSAEQMGFAIIELKTATTKCSQCEKVTNVIQTWWHNKLPFTYVSGQEKLNIHLCLDCAALENNKNIMSIKNNMNSDDEENIQKLLLQYEIENEQIEYYKLFKNQEEKILTN
mgnify:CR=1 FL=1